MNQGYDTKVRELSDRIRRGEYRVDPIAVADAIVGLLWDVDLAAESDRSSSNPAAGFGDPRFRVRGGPRDRTPAFAA